MAVVSDLHANFQATVAVAKDIEEAGADVVWCLGDVVGYGADPSKVLDWVTKHADVVVKGNHDEAVATGDVDGFNPVAASAARYHAQVLSPVERTLLHDLPLESRQAVATAAAVGSPDVPGASVLLVHASPDDPLREYVYPTTARRDLARWTGLADVLFLGHTHVPFAARLTLPAAAEKSVPAAAWRVEGFEQVVDAEARTGHEAALLLVNPGSVGQPRDGDPRAAYAIFDTDARLVELRRVAYDIGAAAAAIREARLDSFLASRLYRGI